MSLTIYLDESGHTGDVFVKDEIDFYFNNQPYFVLAAVGIPNILERDIEELINSLRSKYNIQSNELKVKNKSFSIELMQHIFDMKIPIFIEVTHKKFFLAVQLCNLIIKPLIDRLEETDEFLQMRRDSADLIVRTFPESIYLDFCSVCRKRDASSFENLMYSLHKYLSENLELIYFSDLLEESMNEYIKLKRKNNLHKPTHDFFLPLPDKNKKGEIISSLPHIPSFSNICMRVEKYRQMLGIPKIEYVHDEQAYLWDILFDNVSFLWEHQDDSLIKNNHLKHSICPRLPIDTCLSTGVSKESTGLLIADVISRSLYRFWVEYEKTSGFDSDYCALFEGLQQPIINKYFGVNLVLPQKHVDEYHRSTGQ
ncbi:DUF3800 domain-containing protein [Paenibacillus woosongensis]|uniref:DUF3800 domain-containing protein n=1 Tax=Paenibacillus woosongensis TaxID=307580 RepID=A0A7X2Z478_9BACL|nr:DUF3800 domain-containing protein [Paenibacillus woosongensis]MUG46733.1 DUF3800 domain-containing protein [Paenibacillus woosongensis]